MNTAIRMLLRHRNSVGVVNFPYLFVNIGFFCFLFSRLPISDFRAIFRNQDSSNLKLAISFNGCIFFFHDYCIFHYCCWSWCWCCFFFIFVECILSILLLVYRDYAGLPAWLFASLLITYRYKRKTVEYSYLNLIG